MSDRMQLLASRMTSRKSETGLAPTPASTTASNVPVANAPAGSVLNETATEKREIKTSDNVLVNSVSNEAPSGSPAHPISYAAQAEAWGKTASWSDNSRDAESSRDTISTAKRPLVEEDNSKDGKSLKLLRPVDLMDDVADAGSRGADSGSRGAPPIKQPSIKNYFTHTSGGGISGNLPPVTVDVTDLGESAGAPATSHTPSHTNHTKSVAHAMSANSNVSTTSSATLHQAVAAEKNSLHIASALAVECRRQMEAAKADKRDAEMKVARLENDIRVSQETSRSLEERNTKLCDKLREVYRSMALQDGRHRRDSAASDCVRLGKIVKAYLTPTSIADIWEEGYASKEHNKKMAELLERKEELEKRRKKNLADRRALTKRGSNNRLMGLEDGEEADNNGQTDILDLDIVAETDAVKCHQEQLKKDESSCAEEKKILDNQRSAHQKELRRLQNEDRSRFMKELGCLNNRYQLQCLLGRGGFSEVWKAMDLLELREVAVKIHQLNTQWGEERKASYVKHVTREYKIHREMRHPRVVQFFDVFEIDENSFATVLEYCRGIDLDERLKRNKLLQEKDAKMVLLQITSGLRYLNTPEDTSGSNSNSSSGGGGTGAGGDGQLTRQRKAVIHYDLKPANILFDEYGDVKITDFGLSKVMEDDLEGSTSMELTSQGAGTYWYLPPECFANGDQPPRISSKVDVWSVGVILYQMLYGKRPFGEGRSQERILSEGIIVNSNLEFPTDGRVKVSEEAKEFIRHCLCADVRYRPDVITLCNHKYLKDKK